MIGLPAGPVTVFMDADNTLWDTDSVFADAQRNLLRRVEMATGTAADTEDRLAYVRRVDQAIAERHHARLRYPPKLLVHGLEAALTGLAPDRAARVASRSLAQARLQTDRVDEIEQAFFSDLERVPEARSGVREGLEALRAADCLLLVVTEGSRSRVEGTLEQLSLARFVDRVVEGSKRPELYRRVLRRIGALRSAFMVGDQLDRDIAPAREAGLETIYFPGGFRPRWLPDEHRAWPDHQIQSFAEVPAIVLGHSGGRRLAAG